MPTVSSKDGTPIAYETLGNGPPLILVDGAMCYRDSGPMRPLAEALKGDFAVTIYDRRDRGESGNTLPYAPEREIEDLEALIAVLGGSAHVYGCSSGGMLSLETASRNPGVTKLIAYESPVMVDSGHVPLTETDIAETEHHIAGGNRTAAMKKFMRFVGVPGFALVMMQVMGVFKKIGGVAHTLPYDYRIMLPFQQGRPLPSGRWDGIRAPVLIADGGKSPAWMRNGQRALAAGIPGAAYQTLDGQTHMVKPGPQAPMITAFLKG